MSVPSTKYDIHNHQSTIHVTFPRDVKKGSATYWSIDVGSALEKPTKAAVSPDAAWSYPHPSRPYAALADHLAFYASRVDECTVDGERVTAQPGDFYGGWITARITGPFKGPPGTLGW